MNKGRAFTCSTQRNLRRVRLAAGLLALWVLGASSQDLVSNSLAAHAAVNPHPVLPAVPVNGEIAFVVDHFARTYDQGADDCPEGLATMLRANFVASLPLAERTRLLQADNASEFTKRYREYAQGPDNTDICTHFDRFDRSPQRTVQGRIAQGFNLDQEAAGDGGETGCAHANFTSPAGEAGIDSQSWRALGCLETYRSIKGQPPVSFAQFDMSLANGENAQVLVLRGVDSLVRDDEVELVYANTQDRAILDPRGRFIAGASYRIGETPGGPNIMKGRIVDGVFEASTPRLQLRQIWYLGLGLRGADLRGKRSIWDLRRARVRLSFQADGSVKGMVGGYEPVANVLQVLSMGGIGTAVSADFDCPAIYAAVKQLADGDRDPVTGQCRTISTTLELTARPAFVHGLDSNVRRSGDTARAR